MAKESFNAKTEQFKSTEQMCYVSAAISISLNCSILEIKLEEPTNGYYNKKAERKEEKNSNAIGFSRAKRAHRLIWQN